MALEAYGFGAGTSDLRALANTLGRSYDVSQPPRLEMLIRTAEVAGVRGLGLYQGVPLTRRSSYYSGVLPDKITIYRGPLMRLYGKDPERLQREVKRVVLHEVAHHFGISDERLIEIDRY